MTRENLQDEHCDHKERLPLMLRVKGTVIGKIWWQVLLVTLYSAGVVAIHNYVDGFHMDFPLTLVSVLGVVLGLLLVFRNNTAYDRYWEGRRMWSQMVLNIRNMTRCIWVGVGIEKEEGTETAGDILEKVTAINLLVAFADGVKNYLREEYSYDQDNIKDQICHLPHFASFSKSDTNPSGRTASCKSTTSYISTFNNEGSKIKNKGRKKHYNLKAYDCDTPSNIPIEVTYYLTAYVHSIRIREICDSNTVSTMNTCIGNLVDCLTSLERILRTPIPLAYSVHLHHLIWLYILALPYQLVGNLNWFTIPSLAIASFALLGLLAIGWEIENPFRYEENDLPLDEICQVIRKEAQKIISTPVVKADTWLLSANNHPILHVSSLDAAELSMKSAAEIRQIISRSSKATFIHSLDTASDNVQDAALKFL